MFFSRLNPTRAVVVVFGLSLATIAAAWGFEIIGGYVPCDLCLKQRWAYYAVVPLALGLIFAGQAGRQEIVRSGLVVCALIMIAGAGLGVYHAGAEWGLWLGPQSCGSGAGLSGGLPDLGKARVIRCDEAQWRLFGLSFAGWNVIASLGIAGLALAGARSRDQGSSSVSQ